MTDSSGAPLHNLGHRQGFVDDHRLQRGARTLLGGGDGGLSLFVAVSTSMASFPSRRSRWAAHDDEPSSRAPRRSRLGASSAAKSIPLSEQLTDRAACGSELAELQAYVLQCHD
jgi:hypothetical protein